MTRRWVGRRLTAIAAITAMTVLGVGAAGSATATASRSGAAPSTPPLVTDPASLVNPFIGTGSGGAVVGQIDTFPGADAPFGMMQWSPDTSPDRTDGGGYYYPDSKVSGFSVNHMSGPGCGAYGDLPFLPTVGAIGSSPSATTESFSHSTEKATPGYYASTVGSPGVGVQLATTTRTGIGSFTYPASTQANMLLKLSGSANGDTAEKATIVNDHEIEGSVTSGHFCGASNTYTLHYDVQFSSDFTASGSWKGSTVTPTPKGSFGAPIDTPDGVYLTFDTTKDRTVKAKVGISYVSTPNATGNLAKEDPGWSLDTVKSATHNAWNKVLGRLSIGGGTAAQRQVFYTALYHSLLHPNVFSDDNGQYMGFDGRVHRVAKGHASYANFSGWDIYRSEVPLLATVAPAQTSDIVSTMLADYHQTGQLPKWSQAHGEAYIMVGDPADPIIAGAYAFGARGFDTKTALADMVKEATKPNDIRPGLSYLETRGYLPDDGSYGCCNYYGSASTTLEYNTADFAISRLAAALGNRPATTHFTDRAQDWTNLFDPASGFMQPKDLNGAFVSGFSPTGGDGFVEGDAYQYTPMVPFDLKGLVNAEGGNQAWVSYLNSFFTQLNAGPSSPNAWEGNEPGLEIPWEYDYAGAPWRTQQVVRRIQTQLYSDTPGGTAGNDDLGAMSSWFVWSALGMYPETPGTADLALGSPLFPREVIHLASGKTIDVNAPKANASTPYVQSMTVGGKAWSKAYLPPSILTTGAALDVKLGSVPNAGWASAASDAPPSWTTGQAPAIATMSPSGQVVVKPGGSTTVDLVIKSTTAKAQTVSWRAIPSSGVKVSPTKGSVAIGGASNAAERAASSKQRAAGTAIATTPNTATPTCISACAIVPVKLRAGTTVGSYAATFDLRSSTGAKLAPVDLDVGVATPGDLTPYYNNTGISDDSNQGSAQFDTSGFSYSAQALAAAGLSAGGKFTSGGVGFTWPDIPSGQPDNLVAAGQDIALPSDPGATHIGFVGAATNGPTSGTVTIAYSDGSTQTATLDLGDWTLNAGSVPPEASDQTVATAAYRNSTSGTSQTIKTYVFESSLPLESGKTPVSVTLPTSVNQGELHIFTIGLG